MLPAPRGALLSASDETLPQKVRKVRKRRGVLSERGFLRAAEDLPVQSSERRASNFQTMLDKTLSERSRRSRRGVGGPAGRSHLLPLPSPPSPLEFPCTSCSGPGCSTSLVVSRVLCWAGHSCFPLPGVESGWQPWGGNLGLSRVTVAALSWGWQLRGLRQHLLPWCLLDPRTRGVRGSC